MESFPIDARSSTDDDLLLDSLIGHEDVSLLVKFPRNDSLSLLGELQLTLIENLFENLRIRRAEKLLFSLSACKCSPAKTPRGGNFNILRCARDKSTLTLLPDN